jgi:8-oxo-dGTP pyrophosphatase MutT (NUDIX family)
MMQPTRWQVIRSRVYLFAVGIKRHVTFGVRVALIDGDKVFLIRHTYVPGWQFPGGGIEPGETAEESGAREVFEETGYKVTGPLELFGLYHNSNPATNRDHVAFYIGRNFEPTRAFKPNFEIAEVGWFGLAELPQALSPATAQRIAEIFEGAPRKAVWGIL